MSSNLVAFTSNQKNVEWAKLYELPRYISACEKFNLKPEIITSKNMYKWYSQEQPFAAINLIQFANETHSRFLRYWEIKGTKVLNPILSSKIADDKMYSHLELLKIGVPVPKTLDFHASGWNHDVLNVIEKELGYPFIIKVPNQSQGIGICIANNKYEARDFFDLIYSLSSRCGDYITTVGNVIAQQCMKENLGTDIRAMVLNNKFLGAMIRISLTDWKGRGDALARRFPGRPFTDSSMMTYKPYEIPEYVQKQCLSICEHLNLNFAGFDLFYQDNVYYFGEINTQPNLRNFELCYPEYNITEMIIKFLVEKK